MGAANDVLVRISERRRLHAREQPPLGRALRRDGFAFAANRGEAAVFRTRSAEWRNVGRLLLVSGEYWAMALYRLRTSLRRARVPIVPTIINGICIALFGLRIGNQVLIRDGVYIPHGTVVIDGVTLIDRGCVIAPWVTIGPKAGDALGPELRPGVFVGSHASVLGNIVVGRGSQIGASAVVVEDVPEKVIVGGVPARVLAEGVPGPGEAALLQREVLE
jgi:serine O-acetyltransferase